MHGLFAYLVLGNFIVLVTRIFFEFYYQVMLLMLPLRTFKLSILYTICSVVIVKILLALW